MKLYYYIFVYVPVQLPKFILRNLLIDTFLRCNCR